MPITLFIAVLAACVCIVCITGLLIVVALHLRARADSIDRSVTQLKGELSDLIQESREGVKEMRQAAARVAMPLEDIGHITRTARGWSDRADRLIDAVGTIAEPPVFLIAKNVKTVGGIVSGVLQMLLNPKR
jgi:hypothetical protein